VLTVSRIEVLFNVANIGTQGDEGDDGYPWDAEDDEGNEANEDDEDIPTVDEDYRKKQPRRSGFDWLLGVRQSGYGGGSQIVAKKKKGGSDKKYVEPEPEEIEEYPEDDEEFDEEVEGGDWDDDDGAGPRYAPISVKISITKVFRHLHILIPRALKLGN
jgi:hypothetical protein